ncbi:MAG: acyl-CoA dehydrogenase family protein [Mycobacterium sp.]
MTGTAELSIDGYRTLLDDTFDDQVVAWTAEAEAGERFPRTLSECMHIFGGAGYLVDETPLGRWWRDMKLARVGGGTDEVLWELVAAAMKPDHDGYTDLMGATPS